MPYPYIFLETWDRNQRIKESFKKSIGEREKLAQLNKIGILVVAMKSTTPLRNNIGDENPSQQAQMDTWSNQSKRSKSDKCYVFLCWMYTKSPDLSWKVLNDGMMTWPWRTAVTANKQHNIGRLWLIFVEIAAYIPSSVENNHHRIMYLRASCWSHVALVISIITGMIAPRQISTAFE